MITGLHILVIVVIVVFVTTLALCKLTWPRRLEVAFFLSFIAILITYVLFMLFALTVGE